MRNLLGWAFHKKVGQRLVFLGLLTSIIMIFFNQYQFSLWDQVLYHYRIGKFQSLPENTDNTQSPDLNSPPTIITTHGPRLLLVSPIISTSVYTGIPYNVIFSFQVLLNFFLSAWLLSLVLLRRARRAYTLHIFLGVFLSVSVFMNGRLSYAFLAVSLLIWFFDDRRRKFLPPIVSLFTLLLAQWLASVSSGVVFVVYILIFLMIVRGVISSWEGLLRALDRYWVYLLSLLVTGPWVLVGIIKNLLFYEWSLWKMILHGYGVAIYDLDWRVSFSVLCIGFSALFFARETIYDFLKRDNFFFAKSSIAISLVIGIYGYSIITSFFPSYVILIGAAFLKMNKTQDL